MNACKSSAYQRLQHLKRPLVFLGMATAMAAAAQTASAACTYQIDNEWSNGFVASIQIKNDTAASVNNWSVNWQYANNRVTNSWNANLTGSNPYTASNVSWNGNIAAGQTVSFGFQGVKNGATAERPQINGTLCSAAPASSAASSTAVVSSSRSSSSVALGSSSRAASSIPTGARNAITVRALGTTATESITLSVGGTEVQSWTLSTVMNNYTVETALVGDVIVAFTNDDGGNADVRIDYVNVNGVTRQAEVQTENTGAWGNNRCGGGAPSEWLHCEGYINFGSVTGEPRSSSSSVSSSSSSAGGTGVGSAGCGAPAKLTNGRRTINVNGLNREYVLDIPSNYNQNNPYKLVFGWHWRGGSANDVVGQGYYGMKSLSNNTAIFVAPDRAAGTDGWTNANGRDIAFLQSMLTQLKSSLCIDESRIFSTGWSYGGMMSFAVGRELPTTFRAIAPVSGAFLTPHVDSGSATAAWIAHGNNDTVVSQSSGAQARDAYLRANGCSNTTVPVQPSPCVEYQNCSAGKPVVWCSFNGGHSQPSFYSSGAWNFFNRF
ncbi:cellulose binding domain-containing protein [Cellvibrio sp. KY-YJ-3]|uniref:cellulose binding domain-containing protein n=1 Tax=Cellvibrio sp. KY-YJ-3 TaxID=454662 RepID=UPI0012448698|nr:cellulose binding domain-containing protein [Cellvibrio sp. KY-YJ-3]QEY13708.1 Ricin and poly(3-hydroxybutyrate) depolymerase fusion [Cellvibrio sp. KY-YJ-3]